MKRLCSLGAELAVGAALLIAPPAAADLGAPAPGVAEDTTATKIHVLGIWAHPDDTTEMIGPCGLWHERHDVTCGLIVLTRGEEMSDAAGTPNRADLALQRENEVRAAHHRAGTTDVFFLDAPQFYRQHGSAELTARVWQQHDVLARIVHIIRQTRPQILLGPSPIAGDDGDAVQTGRLLWEAADAASDPERFPEQLTGGLVPWTVKTITAGASTQGAGGTAGPDCQAEFVPTRANPFPVVGTWTGHSSSYTWPAGTVQGAPAGEPMTWAQIAADGAAAFASTGAEQVTKIAEPSCLRLGIARSLVPFPAPADATNTHDDALLYGTVLPDPGGMPAGSLFWAGGPASVSPGQPFDVQIHARSGQGTLDAGHVSLTVPDGWTTSGSVPLGPISDAAPANAVITVTPSPDAAPGLHRLSLDFTGTALTAHNELRVAVHAPLEARLVRDAAARSAQEWAARVGAPASDPEAVVIGAGGSGTVSVEIVNHGGTTRSGEVALTVPSAFAVTPATIPYADLAPGAATTVTFALTAPPTAGTHGTASLSLTEGVGERVPLVVVPTAVIPSAVTAPVLDGEPDAGYGPAIELAVPWCAWRGTRMRCTCSHRSQTTGPAPRWPRTAARRRTGSTR